jgi:hypothetical protein
MKTALHDPPAGTARRRLLAKGTLLGGRASAGRTGVVRGTAGTGTRTTRLPGNP